MMGRKVLNNRKAPRMSALSFHITWLRHDHADLKQVPVMSLASDYLETSITLRRQIHSLWIGHYVEGYLINKTSTLSRLK